MSIQIGVVLGGCGVFDGSEIHEAVSILIAIDQNGAKAVCMAPDIAQTSVINHLTHQPDPAQQRNVLLESARIARGNIQSIARVRADQIDALVFPGGYGAVKNLCSFADKGTDCTVDPQVQRLVEQVHAAGKPIGLACIAPIIAARVLGAIGAQPRLTIGTDAQIAAAIKTMGGQHQPTDPTGLCIDERNKLVTTPCYMNDVGPYTVFQGAAAMIRAVIQLAENPGKTSANKR
ncbi:MAG: isoprenoid biosynthesis glyoxalase ElbB [Phycisphaerales bacterium]|nr:isoprenoid biosynthesis glyoxalase ElbB [Phycisphaerales bacterium]